MKRNLFEELSEGLDALEKEREGKITLREAMFQSKPELSEDRLRTVIREELADYSPTDPYSTDH